MMYLYVEFGGGVVYEMESKEIGLLREIGLFRGFYVMVLIK